MWRGALIDALDDTAPGHGLDPDDLREGLRAGFPWHRPETGHPHLRIPARWWHALLPVFIRAYREAGIVDAVATEAAARVRRHYYRADRWTVDTQARPALGDLRAEGWSQVVLSNHGPDLPVLVGDLALGDLVEHVITSAAVGFEKPHPAIFRLALTAIGRPTRTWMVGDNPVADIEGARAAGIPAILVHHGHGTERLGLRDAAEKILAQSG